MGIFETLGSVARFRRLELDPVTRRLARAASVEDLRRIAKRRLPRGVFDYIDGAAGDERTLARNADAFAEIEFNPRVLRDVSQIDMGTRFLGQDLPLPLVLAPTGFPRVADPEGELAVARAAGRAGLPFSLSTVGTRSIEDVASVASGPLFFQVYVWRDKGLLREMLQRAKRAGYRAILITVDTAVLGRRERDVRNGFTLPPQLGLDTVLQGLLHPGWTWSFLRSDPIQFANVIGKGVEDGSSPIVLADHMNSQMDPCLSWRDIEWFQSEWDGPIVIKGIQSVEDARLAADSGVQAFALSNHGGRQLDGAPAPIDLVAPVADAVGDRLEIICDGGIRHGADIARAVARGATVGMVGRAFLYGLAAGGERGVDHVLNLLTEDLRRTLALIGCDRISKLDSSYLR